MIKVFGDLHMQSLVVFLDDILVRASTMQEMLERLDVALTRLCEINLKLKPTKCNLSKKELAYLGHPISERGIETDQSTIAAIKNWPVPKQRRI